MSYTIGITGCKRFLTKELKDKINFHITDSAMQLKEHYQSLDGEEKISVLLYAGSCINECKDLYTLLLDITSKFNWDLKEVYDKNKFVNSINVLVSIEALHDVESLVKKEKKPVFQCLK